MNTDICKLLYPSRISDSFSERQLYTQKNYFLLSGCHGYVVFWAQKRKLDAKYSTKAYSMTFGRVLLE